MRYALMSIVLAAASAAASARPLATELERIARPFHGVIGYSVHHLRTGIVVSSRGDEEFPSASTIKVAILCAAFDKIARGEIDYDAPLELREQDRQYGTGVLQNDRAGTKVPLRQVLNLMITHSDNTAAIMAGQWLGAASVNGWLEQHGFARTRLLVPFPYSGKFDEEAERGGAAWDAVRKWGIGVTTPNEMRRLLELIDRGEAGTPAACEEMLRILAHQTFDDGIAGQAPPSVSVASKHGSEDTSRSDVAIVHAPGGDYVVAIYTKNAADTGVKWDNEQDSAIRALARAIWKSFEPRSTWSPSPGTSKFYLFQKEPCYPGMPCWKGKPG